MTKRSTYIIFSVIIALALAVTGVLYLKSSRESDTAKNADETRETNNSLKIYRDPGFGFVFTYPERYGLTVLPTDAGDGETILLQNKDGSKDGFQIVVSPFDEPYDSGPGKPGPITAERIKQDIPDMTIESPMDVVIGKGKATPALIFFSSQESFGRTREVWFLGNGSVFQVTGYAASDAMIGSVMETWSFQ